MSTRERWIVYPLLFLALGLVLRLSLEKSVSPIEFRCQTIECQNLRVKWINDQPVISRPLTIVLPQPVATGSAKGAATAAEGKPPDEEP